MPAAAFSIGGEAPWHAKRCSASQSNQKQTDISHLQRCKPVLQRPALQSCTPALPLPCSCHFPWSAVRAPGGAGSRCPCPRCYRRPPCPQAKLLRTLPGRIFVMKSLLLRDSRLSRGGLISAHGGQSPGSSGLSRPGETLAASPEAPAKAEALPQHPPPSHRLLLLTGRRQRRRNSTSERWCGSAGRAVC